MTRKQAPSVGTVADCAPDGNGTASVIGARASAVFAHPLAMSRSNAAAVNFETAAPFESSPPADAGNAYDRIANARNDDGPVASDWLSQLFHESPSWMTSLVVHLVVLIILSISISVSPRPDEVGLEAVFSDTLGEQLLDDGGPFQDQPSNATEMVVTAPAPLFVDDPFSAPLPSDVTLDPTGVASSTISAPIIGTLFEGREEGMRKALLQAYGGSALTEGAVQKALAWLKRQQRKDGTWSLRGPYDDGGSAENVPAATAMALLAFLGNGNTHARGKYKEEVNRGIEALLRMQDADGCFFQEGAAHNARFYTQGQATIAICELYAMTKDTSLEEPAIRAIRYCVASQDRAKGGWRYLPGDDSDTSVTGWILMALQSARQGKLEVPADTLQRVTTFLDSVANEGGATYSYQPGFPPTLSMTAEGLLCRQFLGWDHYDPRLQRGVELLLEPDGLPNWERRDAYYWYYATQVTHHMGGEYWKKWNEVLKKSLVEHQSTTGKDAGSWHPRLPTEDRWGFHGGRLYVTCLSTYMLEVYYRHLPLYSQPSSPPSP